MSTLYKYVYGFQDMILVSQIPVEIIISFISTLYKNVYGFESMK
jgi:hypothetical protein